MRHLTPGELVDLAEGVRDASTPHLAACVVCRRELAVLRAMVSMAPDSLGPAGHVPEPSPLFWDHLSARVRAAVQNEDVPPHPAFLLPWSGAAAAAFGCAIVIAIVAAVGSRVVAPGTQTAVAPPPPPVEALQNAQVVPPAPPGSADDPSFALVADYGGTLDWDELREQMAMSTHNGGMEATVGELNPEERQELRRLLAQELARPAARTDRS